jgi:exo-beta-1,3-glucanase (GH17 family)
MSVWLGDYNLPNDNGTEYNQQKQAIVNVIKTYGVDHIVGVDVGNEFMLKCVHPSRFFSAQAEVFIHF